MDLQPDNLDHAKTLRCPDCLAVNPVGAPKCFLCGRSLGDLYVLPLKLGTAANDFSTAERATRGMGTYSLSSLFLIVTLTAVCCGLIARMPGLAIPLVVLITPALINTFVKSRKKRASGAEFD